MNLETNSIGFQAFILALSFLVNLLCFFTLVIACAIVQFAYSINMIRIKKLIMLDHTKEIEVENMSRDRVYGVKLSRLWLNR